MKYKLIFKLVGIIKFSLHLRYEKNIFNAYYAFCLPAGICAG